MAILNGTSLFFERSSKVDFILPYRTLGLLFLLVLLLPYSSQKLSTSSSKSYPSLSSETEYFTQHNNISSPLEFRHHHSFITVPNASSSASSYSTSWEWTRLQRRHYRSSSLSSSSRTLIDDGQSDESGSERKPSRHSQCLYSRFRSKSHSPGYTTTFIHNNNASLSTSKNQLSKLQRVTNWINRLCSTPDPKDRLEKLLSNSPCSEYKLDICQALTPKDILDIVGSDHFACFKTVEKWWKTFHHIRNLLDDFNLFLPSFDSSPYSVEFELDQCKIAYGFWICSESLPLYLTSTLNNKTMPVAPCRSVCRDVEKRCPFLIRGTEDDKAAGNPTFLCRDENVPSVILEESSPPTQCCYEQIKDPPPGSWRSIKKSSFLDPTSSCLSLLEVRREGEVRKEEETIDKDPGGTWGFFQHHYREQMQLDSSSSTTAEELTACDSFYFVPPNLNVSSSVEKMDWERWMAAWEEEKESEVLQNYPLTVLHYQFNLEEFFLTLFNSSSGSSIHLRLPPNVWVLLLQLYYLLIRTLWNYLTS